MEDYDDYLEGYLVDEINEIDRAIKRLVKRQHYLKTISKLLNENNKEIERLSSINQVSQQALSKKVRNVQRYQILRTLDSVTSVKGAELDEILDNLIDKATGEEIGL
jgi:chorismate mutase